MKSRFFKDTQGLGECYTRCAPDQVCICLRMNRAVYGQLLREAQLLGITSGDYIQRLMEWHTGGMAQREPLCSQSVSLVHQSREDGFKDE